MSRELWRYGVTRPDPYRSSFLRLSNCLLGIFCLLLISLCLLGAWAASQADIGPEESTTATIIFCLLGLWLAITAVASFLAGLPRVVVIITLVLNLPALILGLYSVWDMLRSGGHGVTLLWVSFLIWVPLHFLVNQLLFWRARKRHPRRWSGNCGSRTKED